MPITDERGPHHCDMGVDWDTEARRAAAVHYPYTDGQTFKCFKDLVKPNDRVLEVGCQIASWIWAWRETEPSIRYEGVDWSQVALNIAIQRYGVGGSNVGEYNPAFFYHMDARDMAFKEEYDIVFTHTFFQHTSVETKDIVVPKIYQALKMGGLLIMQENTSCNSAGTWFEQGWIDYYTQRGFKLVRKHDIGGGGTGFVFQKV